MKLFRTSMVAIAWAAVGSAAMFVTAGCGDRPTGNARRSPIQADARGGLFESVAESLDKFEDYDTGQILKQTTDRLNQWYVQEKPEVAWAPDPLLKGLDEELRNQPDVRMIESMRFQDPDDAWYLQEAVWLRDASKVARADKFEDIDVAEKLFDWTVRNIRLQPPHKKGDVRHRPFETLLLGRGTAIERAWVFILLARQQGLDVVYLGLGNDQNEDVRPWLPALLSGDKLYLFDTELGLPIPGPNPGTVATLAEVVAQPELLRRLDLDPEHKYPVTEADLKHVVAYVEASSFSLSRRMALVESRLAGEQKLKLTTPGSQLVERVARLPNIAKAELWPIPFEISLATARRDEAAQQAALKETVIYQAMPTLKKGRALHFKGQYDGEDGAKTQYLNSRPPDNYIANFRLRPDVVDQYLKQGYTSQAVAKLEAAQSLMMRDAKQAASHWIGLVFFEQEDYSNAIDFFKNRVLETKQPTPWADSGRYNLARAYEAAGHPAEAIKLYESDTTSPQSYGNRLRAKWLKEKAGAAESAEGDGKPLAPESQDEGDSEPSTTAPADVPKDESSPE